MSGPAALSEEARRILLGVARAAIAAALDGGQPPAAIHHPEVGDAGSAFVTLRRRADHGLRGCVGLVETGRPLLEVVAEAAVAAATRDSRFQALTAAELAEVAIEISVLGPVTAIGCQEVVVGRHGLVVERGGRRGLLLPQVPVERGWDRETFLDWTCRKAGLPPDAWREGGCRLLGFTALVFAER